MEHLEITPLQHLYKLRYATLRAESTMPEEELICIVKGRKYSDKTANGLTVMILDLITYLGGFATRQQSQGQYNNKLKKYTKSTVKRGVTDITGVLNSKPVNIEVKVGKDRQSVHQKNVQFQIESAGGIYFIARDFDTTYQFLMSEYVKGK